jgi:hypothetical protein
MNEDENELKGETNQDIDDFEANLEELGLDEF